MFKKKKKEYFLNGTPIWCTIGLLTHQPFGVGGLLKQNIYKGDAICDRKGKNRKEELCSNFFSSQDNVILVNSMKEIPSAFSNWCIPNL